MQSALSEMQNQQAPQEFLPFYVELHATGVAFALELPLKHYIIAYTLGNI